MTTRLTLVPAVALAFLFLLSAAGIQTPDHHDYLVADVDSFAAVYAGHAHTCALAADGSAECWGANGFAQLGARSADTCRYKDDGQQREIPCSTRPLAVQGGVHFTSLTLGALHTCGLTPEGAVYCWGDNTVGQLGVDHVTDTCAEGDVRLPCSRTPVQAASEFRFRAVTAGRWHTCGIVSDGSVRCWGSNRTSELGTATPLPNCTIDIPGLLAWMCAREPVPVAAEFRVIDLSAGDGWTCALASDSTAYCWGSGFGGAPKHIVSNLKFAAIHAGTVNVCAVPTEGTPYCWGTFSYPHIRIGSSTPKIGGIWEKDAPAAAFKQITVGGMHICGLTAQGQALCWGRGNEGQLGTKRRLGPLLSKERWTNEPVPVDGELRFVQLSAGVGHTCGVAADGRIYCWGANFDGQLGDGSTTQRNTPVPIARVVLTAGN